MTKRQAAIAMATGLALFLSACMLSAGRFVSSLDIRRSGEFTFTYKGEIYMLALSRLAEMGSAAKGEKPFDPLPCYGDEASERKCSAEEIAEQKKTWAEDNKAARDKAKRDAEAAKMLLGGIDPADPRAAEELAQRIRRQAGFRSVTYAGDGLFNVDFSITGTLDHDFQFPTFERFSMANTFVQIARRADGSVRIDTPGFSPGAGGSPFSQFMQMGAAMGAKEGSGGKDRMPNIPVIDGQFTITTDGTILANNTENGPVANPGGQTLSWTVNPRSTAAPMALIDLRK